MHRRVRGGPAFANYGRGWKLNTADGAAVAAATLSGIGL
jgi:hypothetical protein